MKSMTYTALESHAYNIVLVINIFVRPPIFYVCTFACTVIYQTLDGID